MSASMAQLFGPFWPVIFQVAKIVALVVPLLLAVAYLTYAERKIIGYMQVRIGPNRVGPKGWLQPIADALKLLFKEVIVPSQANKVLYFVGPALALAPSLLVWAAVPVHDGWVVADLDAGLLFILAVISLEVYGIIIAGWASNSKYSFLGAMRASAQMISYEVAMGFGLICVLLVSGSLNLTGIVRQQSVGWFADHGLTFLSWNWLPLLPIAVVYFISGVAETNRAPFDLPEGESEIVAGHMVEYSGMTFALFFLAEYANMILVSFMTSLLFFGGWLSPVAFLPDGLHWLLIKASVFLFLYLWIRATFPRFRYDHVMRLGWKVFVPITIVWLLVVALWMLSPLSIWR